MVILFFSASLDALPAQVILIRHAEKPLEGNELTIEGQKRAAALATYFTKAPEVLRFGPPAALYAMRPAREDSSVRPIQTLTPLASVLNLKINTDYSNDQYLEMVRAIKNNPAYLGKMVLICWEHHVIPEIARAFGAAQAPKKWHGHVFDRVWILTFNPKGVAFEDIPELLQ